jgi:hypothetical protein
MFTKNKENVWSNLDIKMMGFYNNEKWRRERFMLETCLQKHNFACQKTYTQEDDVLLFCFVTLNNGDNKRCMD